MSEVKVIQVLHHDSETDQTYTAEVIEKKDFDLLSQKLELAMAALKQYEACICDDGDTYAAREAIQKIEAV